MRAQERDPVWAALPLAAVALVAAIAAFTGGTASPVVWLLVVTTVAGALTLRFRAFLGLLVGTAVAYAGVVATQAAPPQWLDIAIQVAVIAAVGVGCVVLMRERQAHAAALQAAEQDLRRRAELLSGVARTGRDLHTLDSGKALGEITQAVLRLGFDGAALCRFDEEHSRYEVVLSAGLPREFTGRTHWTAAGIPGLLGEDETVVVTDYPTSPTADPALVAAGYRTVVGVPVWRHGTHAAALLAVARSDGSPGAEVLAAFELLAGQARLAIDNSRRFTEVQRAVKKLAEVDRLKTDFLATVSHELRTPLTVIQGVGRTLEMRWDALSEARRAQLLVQMREHAQRLSRIVGALLDFAALQLVERGRSERVKLSVVIERCTQRMADLLAEHQLIVDVAVGLEVTGDPALLERVVISLLENAAQHTPPGTVVRVTAGLTNGLVTVAVVDDGPGIPAEAVPYLGERFYRASDPDFRGSEGLGLGLAVVREILRLHGSNLEVTSVEGEGSRFSFRLLPHAELPPESAKAPRHTLRTSTKRRAAGTRGGP